MKLSQKLFRLCLAAILAGSALLFTAHPAYADARFVIELTDCDTGVGIGNAVIEIPTAKKGSKSRAVTTAKGRAEFYPVRPDETTHTITISASGYKSATFYQAVGKDQTVELELCLWSDKPTPTPPPTPPPTVPPVPTPFQTTAPIPLPPLTSTLPITATLPLTPTLAASIVAPSECGGFGRCAGENLPTGDQLAPGLAEGCLALLTNTLIDLLPVEEAGQLDSAIATAKERVSQCQGDSSCVVHVALVDAFSQVAAAIPVSTAGKLPPDFIAIPIYNLITNPEGQGTCAQIGPVFWDATRILSQKLQRVDAVALYGPGSILVASQEGQQSGFLPDSSAVQDIPGSISGVIAGSRFVLLPPDYLASVQIQASEDGLVTLDVLHNHESLTQDISYQNVQFSAQATGEVVPSDSEPAMNVASQSVGVTLFQAHPVAPELLSAPPQEAPSEATSAPAAEPTQAAQQPPFSIDDVPSILTAVLVCIIALAAGVLALILLLTKFKKSNASEQEDS